MDRKKLQKLTNKLLSSAACLLIGLTPEYAYAVDAPAAANPPRPAAAPASTPADSACGGARAHPAPAGSLRARRRPGRPRAGGDDRATGSEFHAAAEVHPGATRTASRAGRALSRRSARPDPAGLGLFRSKSSWPRVGWTPTPRPSPSRIFPARTRRLGPVGEGAGAVPGRDQKTQRRPQLDHQPRRGDRQQAQDVANAIQTLRVKAMSAGALKTTKQQTVSRQSPNGRDVVIIESADPNVIYAPSYNPAGILWLARL